MIPQTYDARGRIYLITEMPPVYILVSFCTKQKKYIVYINAICGIDGNKIILETGSLPLSKNYKEELISKIDKPLFKSYNPVSLIFIAGIQNFLSNSFRFKG